MTTSENPGEQKMARLIYDDTTVDEVIAMLKALAEPNRLRIFSELMHGDSCNCELKDNLGLPPNLLSHHLRALSEAGLVTSRRDNIDGRWIYYSVDREAATRWQNWFSRFLDPQRIKDRVVCGPEGQQLLAESYFVELEAID